jgi:murein DD-endopeptidase MepM/ murein hydrolase activator NlpD
MKRVKCQIVIVLLTSFAWLSVGAVGRHSYIEATRSYYKNGYTDIKPARVVSSWMVPFDTKDRYDIRTIQVASVFGAHRESYLKGHIHTATDMLPIGYQGQVAVYPLAEGVVCSIHLDHPHKTIVIKHLLKNGQIVYTSYKHLQEIYVAAGTQVNQYTKIARLYTVQESKRFHGSYDHLHLEIRKSFYDYGCASWLTMNKEDLNELFYNPMIFMKNNLGLVK